VFDWLFCWYYHNYSVHKHENNYTTDVTDLCSKRFVAYCCQNSEYGDGVDLCNAGLLKAPDLAFSPRFYWIWSPQGVQEIFCLCWDIWLFYSWTFSCIWSCDNYFTDQGYSFINMQHVCDSSVSHVCCLKSPHCISTVLTGQWDPIQSFVVLHV
jgi:hypothetical protein